MYQYPKYLKVCSIILIILGGLRSVSFLSGLGTYLQWIGMGGGALAAASFLCDLLASVGALASGVVGILVGKRDKGIMMWSILSFAVCLAFIVTVFLIIYNSNGEYSSSSGRGGLAVLGAIPAIQGLSYIGIEKNWADKWQKTAK